MKKEPANYLHSHESLCKEFSSSLLSCRSSELETEMSDRYRLALLKPETFSFSFPFYEIRSCFLITFCCCCWGCCWCVTDIAYFFGLRPRRDMQLLEPDIESQKIIAINMQKIFRNRAWRAHTEKHKVHSQTSSNLITKCRIIKLYIIMEIQ